MLEHRLVAEEMLGRYLKDEEVVHHIDENRGNNSKNNLEVFDTQEDHARYHVSGVKVKNESEDTYFSPEVYERCKHCKRDFVHKKGKGHYCSRECYLRSTKTDNIPSKGELLALVIENSFADLGRKYGVSPTTISRWCKSYGIPYRKSDLKRLKQDRFT